MSEKLQYVRLKEYDGRLYRIASSATAIDGKVVVFIVEGTGTGSYTTVHTHDIVPVDAYEVLGSVSPAD